MTSPTPIDTPSTPRRRGAALAISITTTVVGGCLLLGTLVGTGLSAAASLRDTGTAFDGGSVASRGLTDLDIDVAGGALTVEYGDVDEARLDTAGRGPGGWTFERDGDTLRVESPRGGFLNGAGGGSHATLVLPQALADRAVDARVEVAGGSLDLDADLRSLSIQLAGGEIDVTGSARDVDVSVTGGSASTDLSGVETAAFDVAGGELSTELSGNAPQKTSVTLTAGSADITLPDEEYRVTSDGSLGSVDNRLRTSSSATAVVEVQASLGQVTLRS